MKKIAIPFLVMIFFISFSGMSQSRTELKGPAAKNYKPWKNDQKSDKSFVTIQSDKDLKGPEAKNQKAWESKTEDDSVLAVNTKDRTNRVMGPEAKNQKPWTNSAQGEVRVVNN